MKTIEAQIAGTSSMLQHRYSEEAEAAGEAATRAVLVSHGTPREQAEKGVYRSPEGFYFPSTWISGALCNAASNHKMKGSRKSARYVVPAAIRLLETEIPITNGDGKTLVKDYEVDSRPATNPFTKGKFMRHRPRFDKWSATFNLVINDKLLPEEFVQQLLTEAGEQTGIGDFRPQTRGPFGCFRVISWKVTE